MSRPAINFIVDAVLLVAFATVLTTATLIRVVFPAPTQADGWTLWRLDANAWYEIEFGAVLALGCAVLLHLILHWTWVCGFVSSRISKLLGRRVVTDESARTIYGVATLILMIVAAMAVVFAAQISVRSPKPAAVPATNSR